MYEVSPRVKTQFEKMRQLDQVKQLLDFIKADERKSIDELKELVQVEAPTHHEEARAAVIAEKFRALGLENVHTGRGGNVIGLRRGAGNGPKVLIEGHLDTVFPFGSVKGVEERDGFLYAPGIVKDGVFTPEAMEEMTGIRLKVSDTKFGYTYAEDGPYNDDGMGRAVHRKAQGKRGL